MIAASHAIPEPPGLHDFPMLVTERVFGFLTAAIAVQPILDGLAMVGVIAPIKH